MMKKPSRILIIEDDPAVAYSLRDGLERDGHQVSWKNKGEQGITHVVEQMPHLIVLDVRLPDMSGFDVCRELRAKGVQQPILMLTVQREESDKVMGLEVGADDYVTKPFSLRELRSRINAMLRRSYGALSMSDSDVIYIRDLVIDRSRGQIRRDGRLIPLTPTEFRLLVYLVRNSEQVMSRADILDSVWGYEPNPENERVVNVHIRRLREKVEIDPSAPTLILTVPGVGYRLVE